MSKRAANKSKTTLGKVTLQYRGFSKSLQNDAGLRLPATRIWLCRQHRGKGDDVFSLAILGDAEASEILPAR